MSDTARGSRVGSQFGHYNLTRLIGRGGMGEVYEAQDTVKQRVVALKLLSPVLSHDPAFRERLQREARTAGRLQDPHVVPIHDYGEIDGQLFLDMRLIDGTDLSAMLKELGPLPPTRAVGIVRQVALALDAAHTAGVIHRDVKPENILVTRDDFAYLVDFGIADAASLDGATQVGDAAGTFKYSAPERFGDATPDHRVDVYSLACVLYECLTGWSPYRGDNARMLITSHLMRPIPRPSQLRLGIVPESFDEVIARGMAKDPYERYGSAGELARAAYQALSGSDQDLADDTTEHTQVVAPPPGGFEQPHRPPPPPAPHVPSGPSYPGPGGGPEPTRPYEPSPVPNAPESTRHFEPGPVHGGGPEPTRPYEPAQVSNAPEPTRPFEPGPSPTNGRAQQPTGGGWPAVPPQAPTGHAWPGEFGTPLPGSLRRSRKPKLLLALAGAAR
ncbi:Serine/threonine-protein kinase PknH [Mycobacterium talmoniae]|uniref:non-specific serine/threonine protein kinase n=1 Tax=Mycobacterium talmoniae TaxID=1858794 RepID=A0A2S8BRV4_9MYCO|nr:Serine/threonine-protein kinase PknH [Mycobacterium talmoniae]